MRHFIKYWDSSIVIPLTSRTHLGIRYHRESSANRVHTCRCDISRTNTVISSASIYDKDDNTSERSSRSNGHENQILQTTRQQYGNTTTPRTRPSLPRSTCYYEHSASLASYSTWHKSQAYERRAVPPCPCSFKRPEDLRTLRLSRTCGTPDGGGGGSPT
jgi:hypothetical protein